MFNFFDEKVINEFIEGIKKFNKNSKNSININTESEKQANEDINSPIDNNNNLSSNINDSLQNDLEINFKLIEDPVSEFKKLHLQTKNKKGELSNFNYLLLINKYSSRTYNDYNQYLVFPLLYMDIGNKKKEIYQKH